MGAVDYWCNIFTDEGLRQTFEDAAEVADVVKWWGLNFIGKTVDEFVGYMDDANVDYVLIPSAKMASYQTRQLIWDVREEQVRELVAADVRESDIQQQAERFSKSRFVDQMRSIAKEELGAAG